MNTDDERRALPGDWNDASVPIPGGLTVEIEWGPEDLHGSRIAARWRPAADKSLPGIDGIDRAPDDVYTGETAEDVFEEWAMTHGAKKSGG